jgi:hypothetical protein
MSPKNMQYGYLAKTCELGAKLFSALAKQQKEVERILIEVQAVIAITKEGKEAAFQKAIDDLKVSGTDSEIYTQLRGLAGDFQEQHNRFDKLANPGVDTGSTDIAF